MDYFELVPYFSIGLQTTKKQVSWFGIIDESRYLKTLWSRQNGKINVLTGLLLSHELSVLKKQHSDVHPLIVLDWAVNLLQRCSKQNRLNVPVDLNRNVDTILAFKKSCSNILKFYSKNIPFALIQVEFLKWKERSFILKF